MLGTRDIESLQGADLIGADGDKLGSIDDLYLDNDTGQPEFALVRTGLFGTGSRFVPLQQAQFDGDDVRVQFTKDQVKDSPDITVGDQLSEEQEQRIYSYYGLSYSEARSDSGLPEGSTDGRDVSGPTTDDAMTRSEEELHVGTERREAGRVRLRKYVVTENVTRTIPVQREEVRVEREPITEGNVDRAMGGPDISEEEHEVVLTEEQPVVEKRTVPKERVRLEKDTVTDERTVSEDVRKERIDTDGVDGRAS